VKKQGILFLVAVVIGLSLIAVFGQASQSKTTVVKMDILKYECCATKVSHALTQLPGVQKVEINSKSARAVVSFDDDQISAREIKKVSKGATACCEGMKDCCKEQKRCNKSDCYKNCSKDHKGCIKSASFKDCCPKSEKCNKTCFLFKNEGN
jgi:copper chaperone CopZ